MAIIGRPFKASLTQVFDIQVRFVMKYYSGQKALPSKKEMLQDTEREMAERWSRGFNKRLAHYLGEEYQDKYFKELASEADIEPVKGYVVPMYRRNHERVLAVSMKYRSDVYKVIDDETFELIVSSEDWTGR